MSIDYSWCPVLILLCVTIFGMFTAVKFAGWVLKAFRSV